MRAAHRGRKDRLGRPPAAGLLTTEHSYSAEHLQHLNGRLGVLMHLTRISKVEVRRLGSQRCNIHILKELVHFEGSNISGCRALVRISLDVSRQCSYIAGHWDWPNSGSTLPICVLEGLRVQA